VDAQDNFLNFGQTDHYEYYSLEKAGSHTVDDYAANNGVVA
jgi:hypothetical protein